MQKNSRINILDSFRFIAILSVMIFHFYSRWAPVGNAQSIYPYRSKYDFFSYGYLGVEFFFIISGFVIAYTLYTTTGLIEFWKKRMMRLFPPMLICTTITFIICLLFDKDNMFPSAHNFLNFICSLTFIKPILFGEIFRTNSNVDYINGSYWSLWPEIQFYFISSLIYYFNPEKFIRNFSIMALFIYLFHWDVGNINGSNILHIHASNEMKLFLKSLCENFNIFIYILWFFIGILFFKIYSKNYDKFTIGILGVVLMFQFYSCVTWQVRLGMVLMILIFSIFILRPSLLNWINYKIIANIGLSSYTLYLIHETIGDLLIYKLAKYFGKFDFLFPILITILFILFALFSYKFIEKPINKFLKQKLLNSK